MTDLAEHLAAGRAAWPEVDVPAEVFAAHVARVADGVEELRGADLYIACALTRQDPAALAAFERRLAPEIEAALGRLRIPDGLALDVRQRIRMHLLVADGRELPRIAEYGGRGALAMWLRVSATRLALKLLRGQGKELLLEDVIADAGEVRDPEVALLKATYGRELRTAVAEAVAELPTRDRNLLRHHVLDGLTIDELAVLFRAHRASCARWLAEARANLAAGTRKRLMARLRARAAEVESILRFLESDIELSIGTILGEAPP